MVKIVAYLPHYDEKIRYEVDVDEKLARESPDKALKEAKQALISHFSQGYSQKAGKVVQFWNKDVQNRIESNLVVGQKVTQPSYIRKGKDVSGSTRVVRPWSQEEKLRAIELKKEGLSYGDIASELGRPYHSVRSKFIKELNKL